MPPKKDSGRQLLPFPVRPSVIHIAFSALLLASVLAWIFIPSWRGALASLSPLVGGIVVLYAAVYTVSNIHVTVGAAKVRGAFDLLTRFDHHALVGVRNFIHKNLVGKDLSGKEIARLLDADKDAAGDNIRILLGYLEDVSVAIQYHHADERVLFRSLGGAVIGIYGALERFIVLLRQTKKDKRIYCELHALHAAWSKNVSLLDGKPLPLGTEVPTPVLNDEKEKVEVVPFVPAPSLTVPVPVPRSKAVRPKPTE